MNHPIGFDYDQYLEAQTARIQERIAQFGDKLYLEFGGKLFDDHHAARVLPGFPPDGKIRMLEELKDSVEMLISISALDIEKKKIRGDLGITYDLDVLRLIDAFRAKGLYVGSVVVTQYSHQPSADVFLARLNQLGVKTYLHYPISGYPTSVSHIVSEEGFGKNQYVETTRPLVVVTAPGPGSGKMATCLSQLYHDHKNGIHAGYAKYETFPVWNLPLNHPVNQAYEAATADLNDVNMIDPFHLEAYNVPAVNYNRDVEVFPLLSAMYKRIMGTCPYQSPTDMGVNMVGNCITHEEVTQTAAKREILRRHHMALCDHLRGRCTEEVLYKIELLMAQGEIGSDLRPVVDASVELSQKVGLPTASIQLPNGHVVTGKTSDLMGATSATLLNALKQIAGIPPYVDLISPEALAPIQELKVHHLGSRNPRLHSDEILTALAISATTNGQANLALQQLDVLRDCDAHTSVIPSPVDISIYTRLGLRLTFEPIYEKNRLFHG